MSQVSTTDRTGDLGTVSVRVSGHRDSPRYCLIKTWPTTSAIKFAIREIERCITLTAEIDTITVIISVFARVWCFGSFVEDDVGFRGGQLVHYIGVSVDLSGFQ